MVRPKYTYLCIVITQNCFQDEAFVKAIQMIESDQVLLLHDVHNCPTFLCESDIPLELKNRCFLDAFPFILEQFYYREIWDKLISLANGHQVCLCVC